MRIAGLFIRELCASSKNIPRFFRFYFFERFEVLGRVSAFSPAAEDPPNQASLSTQLLCLSVVVVDGTPEARRESDSTTRPLNVTFVSHS